MQDFLKTIVEWEKFELLIDTKIFNKDIILKASYAFLDKWYFFFKYDREDNILLHFTKKDWVKTTPENIIWNFSEELLDVTLRDNLERENKNIREIIVERAINWPLDEANFIDAENNQESNQIEFDKDINDILQDIENDPELQVNEEEIESILKEIADKDDSEVVKPTIPLNIDALGDIKKQFKK